MRIPASGILNTDSETVLALNQPLTIVAGETTNSYQMRLKLFGLLPLKDVDIQVIENTTLTPVGRPIGIYVKTQGVLVVDTGSFDGISGDKHAPSEYKLQSGDYLILTVNIGHCTNTLRAVSQPCSHFINIIFVGFGFYFHLDKFYNCSRRNNKLLSDASQTFWSVTA